MFHIHRCFCSVLLATYPDTPYNILWQLSSTLFAVTLLLSTKSERERDSESKLNEWRINSGNISSNKDFYSSHLRSVHMYWKSASSGSEWHYAPSPLWLMTINSAFECAFALRLNEQVQTWILYLTCVIITGRLAVQSEAK